MFNIKKRIYAIHDTERAELVRERSIIVHPRFRGASASTFDGIEEDVTMRGVVFVEKSIEDMMNNRFDGEWEKFYDFLNREEDLQIVVSEHDYILLFKMVQMELQKTYGILEPNMKDMRDAQVLKDYMAGNAAMSLVCSTGGFETVYQAMEFTPTGKLYGNIHELPFEVAYALYKWGSISKTQANAKLAAIADNLFLGQVQQCVDDARFLLGVSPAVLRQYLSDDSITTISDIMAAIEGNELLAKLLRDDGMNFDLSDEAVIDDLAAFCYAVIDNDLDYDASPEADREEFNHFLRLVKEKDVDAIEGAKYNFIATGLVASKAEKFNSILLLHV